MREGTVRLHGEGAPPEGLQYRAVEMLREGSRHPRPTIFITNALCDSGSVDAYELSTTEVADIYLSRWPNMENHFRNLRNGGGLDHSHGYGGEFVTHLALPTALEKSQRKVARAEARVTMASRVISDAQKRIAVANNAEDAETEERAAAKQAEKLATEAHRIATRALVSAQKELAGKQTTPRRIFERDMTRDSIATVLKVMVAMLVQFVLREYFKGANMEYRTFIEHYVNLPVTVVTSNGRTIHRIEANRRNPERTDALRLACGELNRRRLRRDGRLLLYEVVDPPGQ